MAGNESATAAVFSGLVAGIAATAAATLRQVESLMEGKVPEGAPGADETSGEVASPEQRAASVRTSLANARQYIDTLVVLEQKTKGNLTREEDQLLGAVLTDLRITFVKLNDRTSAVRPQSG